MNFSNSIVTFVGAIGRAKKLCALYEYLNGNTTEVFDASDLLRSAIILNVSSFDYLLHEIFRLECIYRMENSLPVQKFFIPMSLLNSDGVGVSEQLNAHIKHVNGHKTFTAPAKIAETLSCFFPNPWQVVCDEFETNADDTKRRLKMIVDWRNRIAHEADIHPDYGGTQLWPIYKIDVEEAIDFLEKLGCCMVKVLEEQRPI